MKLKTIYIVAGALIIMASAACKKDLLKTNSDPTKIVGTQYNPNFLLTTSQLMYTGSTDFEGEPWQTEWCEIAGFIQHTSSTNTAYYSGDKYLNNNSNFGSYFTHAYAYQVQPVVELYQLTLNKPQYRNLHQMARMMKALIFERLTDLYGDIPYSQAGLGYYSRIYTPVYDKQQDIYTDLLKEVSQATDSLITTGDRPAGDVFFSADSTQQIPKWKKFGYTLQLRMAMRLTKVDPATAQTYVKKVQGLTMASNDDNALVEHAPGMETQNRDSWEILGQDSADLKLCDTYINNLKANKDPRGRVMSWIYATGDTILNDQFGLPQGFIIGGADPAHDITKQASYPLTTGMAGYSRFADNVLGLSVPNYILTYSESEFLLADAAKRWGIGNAQTHYQNGVLAAMDQVSIYGASVSSDEAAYYLAKHPYNDADGLNQINTQFWLCTVMDEYEAWCNWRRTGYPVLTPTVYKGNITNGTIPRRLAYPANQKVTNDANYNAAVARLSGGDQLTSRMWWDK